MKKLKSFVVASKKWLAGRDLIKEGILEKFESDVQTGTPYSMSCAAFSLSIFGIYYGHQAIAGAGDICAGDGSPLSKCLTYLFWDLNLCVENVESGRGFGRPIDLIKKMDEFSCLLAAFIALEDKAMIDMTVALFKRGLKAGGASVEAYFYGRTFERFILWLGSGKPVEWVKFRPSPENTIYSKLMAQWYETEGWPERLSEMLEYHYSHVRTLVNQRESEFTRPPFDAMPFEIVAVIRAKQKEGVEIYSGGNDYIDFALAKLGTVSLEFDPICNEFEKGMYNAFYY